MNENLSRGYPENDMTNAPSAASNAQPIWSRKRDLFYVVFLFLVVFLALTIDLVPLYPVELPSWATILYDYFRINYNDPLYEKDPPFFRLYVIIEAVFSVPTCIWAIRGLIQDDKMVPAYLLVLATHLVTSTLVCLVEILGTHDWPKDDIKKNVPGYVGFFAIATCLWLDMFLRVKATMTRKMKVN